MADTDWTARHERTYSRPGSRVTERVWREVYGHEYPENLHIHSYVTRSELTRMEAVLGVGAGQVLVDAGCGRGGPGLRVSGRRGARLIGVDVSAVALRHARRQARAAGRGPSSAPAGRAEFRLGAFDELPLADASVDGVMTVDALLFAPDKAAACREAARVLRPGSRLVGTTWDFHTQPDARPPQVTDHRPVLEAAGFTVCAYEVTDRWRERQVRTTELLLDSVTELAAESDGDPAVFRSRLRELREVTACASRRVLFAAELTPVRAVRGAGRRGPR
ncbi:class I SAM-dependent methyltransferase [Streptomyces flavofungini]|uniref:Methyltransferase domain-containing protein n=1 Tax=Streptomyces flavofungini TaxID=68200 RepID=A0ABS0X7D8_9ACTN|nr:class I SAM-dependent methyltransferase [Streptomyces flavofungini]MBJ3809125.1 methyltransferase domain-containing protein [Streptomyces flavofungini]